MLKIHHAPGTRGFRTIWACEELGVPYEAIPVDMSRGFRGSPGWRKMNPVGKVPVMSDGDFVMFESCAMTQYVLDRYGEGRLQPRPGTPEHGTYLQWCWFSEATFSRPIGEIVNHRRSFADAANDAVIDEMKGRARLSAQAVEETLDGKAYLLGDEFSGADISMGYTLKIFISLVDENLSPNLSQYWARLTGREAYRAAEAAEADP